MNRLDTPDGRFYELDGRLLQSVTTILGKHFDIKPETDEERIRWAALAERGSRIHALIANPPTRAEYDALPPEYRHGLDAAQRFKEAYGYKVEDTELELGSVKLGYAGTLDSAGRVPKGRILVDYKTGRLRYQMLRLQLGAYYGLYVATYPRRKLFGAMGVMLNVVNGGFTAVSFSAAEMQQSFGEFMEIKEEYGHTDNNH